jgi:hypothetical protein
LDFILTSTDEDSILWADGKTTTTITMTAIRDGQTDENFRGTVNFASQRLASFSKANPVAFEKGVASVQLTSIYSAVTTIYDTITATLVDTPDDAALQGDYRTYAIAYVPAGEPGEDLDNRIFVTNAGSDSASHVYLTFNKAYDMAKLSERLGQISISRDRNTGMGVAEWRQPVGIVAVDPKTVRVDFLQTQALRDNTEIYVQVQGGGGADAYLVTQDQPADMIRFTLNDIRTPEALNALGRDIRTIQAQFTKPVVTRDYITTNVATSLGASVNNLADATLVAQYLVLAPISAGVVGNWELNGHRLNLGDIAPVNPAYSGIDIGILNENDSLVVYDADNNIDNRAYVTIQLSAQGAGFLNPTGQPNILQIVNTRDFAGLTDPANIANTQEFRFVTPPSPGAPAVDIIQQSVEQYKITFNQALAAVNNGDRLTPNNVVFEQLTGGGVWMTIPVVDVAVSNDADNQEVSLTELDSRNYLLELNADWTVIKNTYSDIYNRTGGSESYYTDGENEVRITIYSGTVGGTTYPSIENKYGDRMTGSYREVFDMARDIVSPTVANHPIYVAHLANSLYAEANGYVVVTMSEPVQVNTIGTSLVNTIPFSPSVTQMGEAGVMFDTRTPNLIGYITGISQTKSNAIPTPTFNFDRHGPNGVILETVPGKVIFVDPEDFTFVVEPANPLNPGTWTMTILSISDDVGNTSATQEIDLDIAGAPAPSTNPYVVWADVHDNIYDLRNGQYLISDLVHIQYSKAMSIDVLQSSMYTVNGNPLPQGVSITWEHNVAYDANRLGDLVTIHLPYRFLGEEQSIFITNSTKFTDPALYPHNDPYEPVDHHTIDINPSVKDTTNVSLTGSHNLVSTYDPAAILGRHVDAYVNADEVTPGSVLESRRDIAAAIDAQNSIFVRRTIILLPYYTNVGVAQTTEPDITFTGTTANPVNITPPLDGNNNPLPLGDVTVTAPNAESVAINAGDINGVVTIDVDSAIEVKINAGTIAGNVDIEADIATNVEINAAEINGDTLVITAPEATTVEVNSEIDVATSVTITANKEGANISLNGPVTTPIVTINSTEGASVAINDNVTGNVAIDADEATITVNGNIDGNLTIDSDNGEEIRISGDVTGTLTVTAQNATVYVLPGTDTTGINALTIVEIAQDTLVVGEGVTIDTLTIASTLTHPFTIKYSGVISNLILSTAGVDDITVLIKSNGTSAQEIAASNKFDTLRSNTTPAYRNRLKFATKTSL